MLPTHNLAVCPICTEDPANVKVPRAVWQCACGGNNEKWAQRTSSLGLSPTKKRWREGECSECGDANAVIEVDDFLCKACRWHRDNPMHDDGHTVTFTLEGSHPVHGSFWQFVPHVRCPMSEDERDGAPCAIPNAGCLVEALFGDGDDPMEHYIDPVATAIELEAENRIAWSYSSHYDSYSGESDEEYCWRLVIDEPSAPVKGDGTAMA